MVWWISTPDITRGKGDEVHILINSRPVASGPFQSAIRRGYKTRLMVGRHPVAVLNLNCHLAKLMLTFILPSEK